MFIIMERSIAPPNEKAQVIPKVAFTAKPVPPTLFCRIQHLAAFPQRAILVLTSAD